MTTSVDGIESDDPRAATPAEPASGVSARLGLRRVLTRNILVVAALSGLAVTQPLLDLFGRNPEIFVAQDIRRRDILLFALIVTLLIPLVGLVLELLAHAIGPRVGQVVHAGLVALLSFVLGLMVANKLGAGDVLSVLLAFAASVGITVASLRVDAVERILRYLSLALVLFLVTFLFLSRTGELIRAGEAAIAEGVYVGNPAPVVIVQLDEFPVASLLDSEGEINAERFPNFQRLAESASWFRNARSISPETGVSVPSALSGMLPESGALPISADHPNTIFTLLGEHYDFVVDEPITDLCPSVVCVEQVVEGDVEEPITPEVNVYDDALVVLGHVVLPPFLADDLPEVDQSWGGYLAGVTEPDENPDDDLGENPDSSGELDAAGVESVRPGSIFAKWNGQDPAVWAPRYQAGVVEQQIANLGLTVTPTVYYSHAVFPHSPWHLAPSGDEFRRGDSRAAIEGTFGGRWDNDEWYIRQGLQRHLLQVGYADTMIGEMIDRLQAIGLWDDALVVVMSDHGVAFVPGESPRFDSDPAEIYNVPLFIKQPGVTEGETRDDDVLLIDVLPSIVDLLDVKTDWTFDGRSLFRDEQPDGTVEREPADFESVLAVVGRNEDWLPYGESWAAIAAVGEYGDLVGRSLDALDVVGLSEVQWSLDQSDDLADWQPDQSHFVPLLWTGSVTMPDDQQPPPELLAVVNGRVAGVVGGFGQSRTADDHFSGIITDEPLTVGANQVSLLVPIDGGRRFEQTGGPT